MGIYDEQMDKKITRLMGEEIVFDDSMPTLSDQDKKYF